MGTHWRTVPFVFLLYRCSTRIFFILVYKQSLKLWENSDSNKRFITHAAYLEVGGLFEALNYYADLFFENLSNIEQSLLERIFPRFVRAEITNDVSQRQLKKRLLELARDSQDEQDCLAVLLQKLLDEQFLVQKEEDGEIWIALAHEMLIEKWRLFRNWQQETRKKRQLLAPLEDSLLNWQKNPNSKNLATPEVLKGIKDNQESLDYLYSLDTSIKLFYQQSFEYHKWQGSIQLATIQGQEDSEQLGEPFGSDFTQVDPSSRGSLWKRENSFSETFEQKKALDRQIEEQIRKEPNRSSVILNSNITKEIRKQQEVSLSQVYQPASSEWELENEKFILIDFAIITAIKTERLAVLKAFEIDENKDRVRKGSRTYWHKRLLLKDGKFYEIIVAQTLDMANVNAAIRANDTLHHWQPAAVLMVGIAATAKSEPEQHLGNLVIGKEVYYYETGKITAEGKLPEPRPIPVDATLLDRVQALPDSDFSILAERPDGTNIRPQVEPGVIASGDKVIADVAERDAIAAANRKIMAIEMEGYGVISAAWQSFDQVRCLVIRALCDYADSNKHDQWHTYASAVAASFTKHFLLDEPLPPRNQSSHSETCD